MKLSNMSKNTAKKFVPYPFLKNGSLQTIVANLISRTPIPKKSRIQTVKLSDGDQINLFIDRPDNVKTDSKNSTLSHDKVRILLMHGLGGSCESKYILRIGAKLNQLGFEVVRFNHRGCGPGGQALARNIYHAGQTKVLDETLRTIKNELPTKQLLLVSFSLSANLVLKYLGESEEESSSLEYCSLIKEVFCICPPINLANCSKQLALPKNFWLDQYFIRKLVAQAKSRSQIHKIPFNLPRKISIGEFDRVYTAPQAGFKSREEYYQKSSSKKYLSKIKTPTRILIASDDPVVPVEDYNDLVLSDSTTLDHQQFGGHMGFISRTKTPQKDRFWMDAQVLKWAKSAI